MMGSLLQRLSPSSISKLGLAVRAFAEKPFEIISSHHRQRYVASESMAETTCPTPLKNRER